MDKIQTGYQWGLEYELTNNAEVSYEPSASAMDAQIARVAKALQVWHELQDGPKFLIYPLQHCYTPGSVDLANLRGRDHQRTLCVRKGCAKDGKVSLLLAQVRMKREVEDGGVTESRALCDIRNLDGIPLCQPKRTAGLLSDVNLLREISYAGRGRHSFLCTHEWELAKDVQYEETFLDTASRGGVPALRVVNTNIAFFAGAADYSKQVSRPCTNEGPIFVEGFL